jgi:hypothetical protein
MGCSVRTAQVSKEHLQPEKSLTTRAGSVIFVGIVLRVDLGRAGLTAGDTGALSPAEESDAK